MIAILHRTLSDERPRGYQLKMWEGAGFAKSSQNAHAIYVCMYLWARSSHTLGLPRFDYYLPQKHHADDLFYSTYEQAYSLVDRTFALRNNEKSGINL